MNHTLDWACLISCLIAFAFMQYDDDIKKYAKLVMLFFVVAGIVVSLTNLIKG